MSDCPCKGCPDRHEACHDHCEKYREWKKPLLASYADRKNKSLQRGKPHHVQVPRPKPEPQKKGEWKSYKKTD